MTGDRGDVAQPLPDAGQQRGLHDGREHGAFVHELLDLVEHGFAPLSIHLDALFAEQPIEATRALSVVAAEPL